MNRERRVSVEQKWTFANNASEYMSIFKMYKESEKLNSNEKEQNKKKTNQNGSHPK